MFRLAIILVLFCMLASVPFSALWAQVTPTQHAAVFRADSWDDCEDSLVTFSGAIKLTGYDSLPDDREEGEPVSPPDPIEWEPQQGTYLRDSQERLIDRIVDPTAWLMNFRFRESWNWPVSNSSGDSQEFEFRPTVPFRAWDQVNILRVTVPYTVSGPSGPGLGNIQILDLVVHETAWGRWGVGPVVQLTPSNRSDSDSFQIGPAAGAVSKSKHWTVGFLTQNFFGQDVAESRVQPILAYKFNEQWAVGVGEFEFRYDWVDAKWTQVPLGIEVDYITELFGQKAQLFANPQYNFESDASNSGWTLFIGLALLVPDA